ncbi:MAG: hypothetical protein NXI23_11915 [Bacteroidetes bacterium]|jgi:hypothetical protein|nr:hypothetical protein [Bacteroidota bacterium]MDF1865444.1 hypothetical protein [Saprospiraceae bacterium]
MKRYLLAFSLLASFFLLTSSTNKIDLSILFNFRGGDPILPNQPFDYKNIEFPEHVIQEVGQ